MAMIEMDKQHYSVIQSAIELGDWFLSLPQLSEQDKTTVQAVQQELATLPKINDGTFAMYGFSLESGTEDEGLIRGWDVSIEYFANNPEQQGGLEIFSSYLPIPESTDADVLAIKTQNEVYFCWQPHQSQPNISPVQLRQWQNEVSAPLSQLKQADRVRIELVYQNNYSEIIIPFQDL